MVSFGETLYAESDDETKEKRHDLAPTFDRDSSRSFLLKQEFGLVTDRGILAAFYTRLVAQVGHIIKLDGSIGTADRGWIVFRLHCQRGELTMSMKLDADDRISGIRFRPAPAPSPNVDPFVLRLFSWPHLIWLVPFFLGGLVYTWLIQKTTERALGISSLRVHLGKGQNLILWDEINEVRPSDF